METHVSKHVSRRRLGSEQVTPCSGGVTPQVISRSVHHLAEALSHIQQGIERRFLQPPLGETHLGLERFGTAWKSVAGQTDVSTGEEDSKKEQKMKKNKKKDEDRESEGTPAMCGLARPGEGTHQCALSLRWQ